MKILTTPVPETANVPLQQHPAFVRALQSIGRQTLSFGFEYRGDIFGHVQIITGYGKFALASRGPIFADGTPPDQIIAAHSALAKPIPHLALIINAHHPIPLNNVGYAPLITAPHIAQLNLCGDRHERLARLHQKWRNRLRRAQDSPLKTETAAFDPEKHMWLLDHDARQKRMRGYKNWPTRLTLAFAANNPNNTRIFIAYLKNTPVAAMLFLRHGPRATYHIGYTNNDGRTHNAHNLLLWQAINWLTQNGHKTLDLGTIDTEANPDLARFKLGTGADAIKLGGTWLHMPFLSDLIRYKTFKPQSLTQCTNRAQRQKERALQARSFR